MLKITFKILLSKFTVDNKLKEELWSEIEKNYTKKKRHYHTLIHLENLLIQLVEIKTTIKNWESILFTLYYHDIIYNPLLANNEEKSGELAVKRMTQLLVPIEITENTKKQILATKAHKKSTDSDTNYFTDADLSIVGASWENYLIYATGIRKEYSIYPELIYKPGRKKVLIHFLSMDRIYKTDYFFDKLESNARENIKKEIELL